TFNATMRKATEKEHRVFLRAVSHGHLKKTSALLKKHPDAVTWHDWKFHDNLPLNIAVGKDNADMVKLLLDHGAKVNAKNSKGDTALVAAIEDDLPKMVELLLRKGASPHIRDIHNWTPLEIARKHSEASHDVLKQHFVARR